MLLVIDLLYVGGAYKCGHLMMESIADHHFYVGLPWFLICGMVLAQQWLYKLNLESRFGFSSFVQGIFVDSE